MAPMRWEFDIFSISSSTEVNFLSWSS